MTQTLLAFTDTAKNAIVAANEYALQNQDPWMDARILLRTLLAHESDAGLVIKNLTTDDNTIQQDIAALPQKVFPANAKPVLQHAGEQCRSLKHEAVSTGHLLLGILAEGDEETMDVLVSHNITHQSVLSKL